ncbi:H-NS histone family protein [Dokdonella sp. MW10]|uniref:H-NS histone family protein n=1 Tax=Dokdonella sp. MW10 TaxID=2992926 RepID=UPI003F7DA404
MSKTTLDSLAAAKSKLAEELRKLEEQEAELRQQHSSQAFAEVIERINEYGGHFTAEQKAEIFAAVRPKASAKVSAPRKQKAQVAPKYWLPHNGETWSGRGRTPRAFAAWEGTAAYNQWKASHPNEKFPKYPG